MAHWKKARLGTGTISTYYPLFYIFYILNRSCGPFRTQNTGVKRVKESIIKQMEKSESKAEVYTASNYRLAEIRRGIEAAKKGFS